MIEKCCFFGIFVNSEQIHKIVLKTKIEFLNLNSSFITCPVHNKWLYDYTLLFKTYHSYQIRSQFHFFSLLNDIQENQRLIFSSMDGVSLTVEVELTPRRKIIMFPERAILSAKLTIGSIHCGLFPPGNLTNNDDFQKYKPFSSEENE